MHISLRALHPLDLLAMAALCAGPTAVAVECELDRRAAAAAVRRARRAAAPPTRKTRRRTAEPVPAAAVA